MMQAESSLSKKPLGMRRSDGNSGLKVQKLTRYSVTQPPLKHSKTLLCNVLQTKGGAMYLFIVIVLYTMFILQHWTELKGKHCRDHYDRKNQIQSRPLTLLFKFYWSLVQTLYNYLNLFTEAFQFTILLVDFCGNFRSCNLIVPNK